MDQLALLVQNGILFGLLPGCKVRVSAKVSRARFPSSFDDVLEASIDLLSIAIPIIWCMKVVASSRSICTFLFNTGLNFHSIVRV